MDYEEFSIEAEMKEFIQYHLIKSYTHNESKVEVITLEENILCIEWGTSCIVVESVNNQSVHQQFECMEQILHKYSPLFEEAHSQVLADKLLGLL